MTRIVSLNDILRERRERGFEVEEAILPARIGEMITTSQGLMDLVEKVRVDVAFGQAEVPTLYEPIYRRVNGPFPGRSVDIGENTLQFNGIFVEKLEGGEVQFGTLQKGAPASARLATWALGFEWTEDMEEWDSTWQFELINQAYGRAYNNFLNHVHLSPILTYSYTSGNQTPADTTAGASVEERVLRTFMAAYQSGVSASPQRTPSVLLASEADRFLLEASLLQPLRDTLGNQLPRVPIDTIIYYDGADVEMNTELYQYPGVTEGKAYFIYPKRTMLEFVHHDLRIDAGDQDISRLIEAQVVGRTRRGIFASIDESVEEVSFPTT